MAGNLPPCKLVLKTFEKYMKDPARGPGNISIIVPNWVHHLLNQRGSIHKILMKRNKLGVGHIIILV